MITGDGWELYVGENAEILPRLETVDHVITDPPYSERTHAGAMTQRGAKTLAEARGLVDFECIPTDELRARLGAINARRWLVMTCDLAHAAALDAEPPDGWRAVRVGCWTKPDGMPQVTGDRPAQGWEAVSILHRADERLRWNRGGARGVWRHGVHKGGIATQKPVALLLDFVRDFTDPGDVILDPWCGSGTTGVAALALGRRFVGIERRPEVAEIAARRLRGEPSRHANGDDRQSSIFDSVEVG